MAQQTWTAQDIFDDGERVSHLNQDFFYYGHLSIYRFAARYAAAAKVLDVGCGAGYGSAFLASHGALQVMGIDTSAKAIQFCRDHFCADNLEFRQMSADSITDFSPHSLDFVFTSNTLEHVSNVARFLQSARTLLKPDGKLLVAVPPITNDHLLYLNVMNPYHVNLWSPRQWEFALGQYFGKLTPVLHGFGAIGGEPQAELLTLPPTFDEHAFCFAAGTIEEMYQTYTLTAIFVAEQPRACEDCPQECDSLMFIDGSFSRPAGYIDPLVRRRLHAYFSTADDQPPSRWRKAGMISITRGVGDLLKETGQFVRRKLRRRS